jgi:hypothetical protein
MPRPARTPPSTFLFLHLYLSNSPKPEGLTRSLQSEKLWCLYLKRTSQPHPTPNDNRQLSAVFFTHLGEELNRHGSLPGLLGPGAAALSGRVIGPAIRACQRPCQEIVASHPGISASRETLIYQAFAPYLSHIPATSCSSNMPRRGEYQYNFAAPVRGFG